MKTYITREPHAKVRRLGRANGAGCSLVGVGAVAAPLGLCCTAAAGHRRLRGADGSAKTFHAQAVVLEWGWGGEGGE